MQTKFAISFDDGLAEQYQWSKDLYARNISGTFYINPSTINTDGYLTLEQLTKMAGDGHYIANHLWKHQAPKFDLTLDDAIRSLLKTKRWLRDNGFSKGEDLVALPYGFTGGHWPKSMVYQLGFYCKQLRDVTFNGCNDLNSTKYVGATGEIRFNHVDGFIILHYFHGMHEISQMDFEYFLDSIKMYESIPEYCLEITTMREIADSKGAKYGDSQCT